VWICSFCGEIREFWVIIVVLVIFGDFGFLGKLWCLGLV